MVNSMMDGDSLDTAISATQPLHNGSRMIASERLAVELMDPNDPQRYSRGVRFTPVAAVIRATSRGREFLFHKAVPDPQVDVAGLFAEFDLAGPPPGFSEAAIGDPFVKIGVGALKKTSPSYHFYTQYPLIRGAQTTVKWRPDTATFEQWLEPVNGCGYVLEASVQVSGMSLTIHWTLENTGGRPFTTQQYLHNSFLFDGRVVGPDYTVSFPFDFVAKNLQVQQRQIGNEIRFEAPIPRAVNIEVVYPPSYSGENAVSVSNPTVGMRVQCVTSLRGERVALHASKEYICPEQFVAVSLLPGQSQTWFRRYTFDLVSESVRVEKG
jgi:hypothetical protein